MRERTEITGAQVRMARAFLRWSIAELATRANVGISSIQRIVFPRFRTFSDSLYARARVNVNLELSRSGNGVRNGFRRPDGRGSGQFAEAALTRSMWRATGADGAGFACRYWLSPNSANAWPLQGRIDIVAF